MVLPGIWILLLFLQGNYVPQLNNLLTDLLAYIHHKAGCFGQVRDVQVVGVSCLFHGNIVHICLAVGGMHRGYVGVVWMLMMILSNRLNKLVEVCTMWHHLSVSKSRNGLASFLFELLNHRRHHGTLTYGSGSAVLWLFWLMASSRSTWPTTHFRSWCWLNVPTREEPRLLNSYFWPTICRQLI